MASPERQITAPNMVCSHPPRKDIATMRVAHVPTDATTGTWQRKLNEMTKWESIAKESHSDSKASPARTRGLGEETDLDVVKLYMGQEFGIQDMLLHGHRRQNIAPQGPESLDARIQDNFSKGRIRRGIITTTATSDNNHDIVNDLHYYVLRNRIDGWRGGLAFCAESFFGEV
ncbi:hypothetical protein P175DRAFT_0533304 [Aspergillus ochraceoroseus IBT 24754]|uniref:Uncharacterized protein n=1 Tax=Aspergillus ochraceoroseus IBT 24754 TaxID=1392256 RepID=A0A2T5LVK3_9EURO|nr:uncharacterized protein P175DRAFT_0533304 [Aspergillus ochraceoroseus IBT 24754]PTU20309.1 hypothetical protein P175DRAFT_0533304 [Aspergillus ochraceoroseus IBT 24754]